MNTTRLCSDKVVNFCIILCFDIYSLLKMVYSNIMK